MKIVKILALVMVVVAVAVGAFAYDISGAWPVRAAAGSVEVKIERTPERIAQGKRLVSVRCASCHYDQKTKGLTGQRMLESPAEFGPMFSHNITQHPTKGIGRYTDGELVYLLRTGVRRDGIFTGPFMQSPHLADEDLYSIIAFLRSDDPWTAPQDVDDRNWQPSFLAKFLMNMVFKPGKVPTEKIIAPPATDKVAFGRYLAQGVADCYACHSKDFKTANFNEPEKSEGFFGGGNPLSDGSGNIVYTSNITMDPDTGIGKWSEADFVQTMRTGFRPDQRTMRYPMVPFAELTDAELSAIYAYLKTVPVLHHEVDRRWDAAPVAGASASAGEKLYNKYSCWSCHGTSGTGVCDLRHACEHYDTDDKLSAFIHEPAKFAENPKMPRWAGVIAEDEYAPLVAYLKSLSASDQLKAK